jgi:hypothetical protein
LAAAGKSAARSGRTVALPVAVDRRFGRKLPARRRADQFRGVIRGTVSPACFFSRFTDFFSFGVSAAFFLVSLVA